MFGQLLGFNANHASLTVQAILDGTVDSFKFFVKTASLNPIVYERYWKSLGQFYKEHVFYTRLVKDLQKFVDKKITADCYLSKLNDTIVLEDLADLGYETSKLRNLDMQHAELAIESLANLHAASLLYEEKTGISICDKYEDVMYESLVFVDKERPTEHVLFSVDRSMRTLGDKYFQHVKPDDRSWLFTQIHKTVDRSVNDRSSRYRRVVCQGDPWGNNILYKYSKDGRPEEAILVDFGCHRFVPPALELMQFIYLALTSDFRARHKSEIIHRYYAKLGDILAENGVSIDAVLPRKEFLESCDAFEEFGLSIRVYYTYFTQLPGDFLLKAASSVDSFLGLMTLGNAELATEAFEADDQYRALLTESVEEAFRHFSRRIYPAGVPT
ncbi:unnamed protein product, partial [Nesidiocoris tenuis]